MGSRPRTARTARHHSPPPTTSPPRLVLRARHAPMLMALGMKATWPAQKAALTPPACRLRAPCLRPNGLGGGVDTVAHGGLSGLPLLHQAPVMMSGSEALGPM